MCAVTDADVSDRVSEIQCDTIAPEYEYTVWGVRVSRGVVRKVEIWESGEMRAGCSAPRRLVERETRAKQVITVNPLHRVRNQCSIINKATQPKMTDLQTV